jgi:microcystin-dependent protein
MRLSRVLAAFLVVAFAGLGGPGWGAPSQVNYQGQLKSGGSPFTGTAYLKFAIVDGATSLWSNDGTSAAGGQPTGSVTVLVDGGVFSVRLGAPPMNPLSAAAFNGQVNPVLRVWASTGGSFEQLSPDQPLTSVPFAFLGVETALPPGSVMAYMGAVAPAGWLLCDGSEVSRSEYSMLFAVIGAASGAGNGSTTFNVPDLRGRFLRGWNGAAGADPDAATRTAAKPGGNTGNNIGSLQADELKSHNHSNGNFNRLLQYTGSNTITTIDHIGTEPDLINSAPLASVGGSETRPKNVYVNYIIKY